MSYEDGAGFFFFLPSLALLLFFLSFFVPTIWFQFFKREATWVIHLCLEGRPRRAGVVSVWRI